MTAGLRPRRRVRLLATDRARRPLAYMRWTPPQLSFLRDKSRTKLLRLAQQFGGKTFAGLAAVIDYITENRYGLRRPPGAVTVWVVCYSHEQSLVIQSKLWALLPKDLLAEDVEYLGEAKGFRGKHTAVSFRDGSVIKFKTTNQGAEALASGTVHMVLCDEPPPEDCYREAKARLRRTNGYMLLTLTPINSDCTWLRKEVESGKVSDHCFPLTQANCTPEGSDRPLPMADGTLITDAVILELRREVPAAIAATVIDGEWEARGVDRYFDVFVQDPSVPNSHVTPTLHLADDAVWRLHLGIDHGDRPGKQVITLSIIIELGTACAVYTLDEYWDETGQALPEDDAQGVLAMLARHEWTWADLDFAMGDRVHLPGSGRQKSNRDLEAHLARQLGVKRERLRPPIRTAKRGEGRGRGSVEVGARWIYQAMVRGSYRIHPRCVRTIEALNTWTGPGPDSPAKDPIDSLRYALDPYIFGGRKPAGAMIRAA